MIELPVRPWHPSYQQVGIAPELRSYAGIQAHWYSPLAESNYQVGVPKPLFPRIDLPAEDAE